MPRKNNFAKTSEKAISPMGVQMFVDPKTGIPYLECNCHLCDENNIFKFSVKKKKYVCHKCKKLIFTIKEEKKK